MDHFLKVVTIVLVFLYAWAVCTQFFTWEPGRLVNAVQVLSEVGPGADPEVVMNTAAGLTIREYFWGVILPFMGTFLLIVDLVAQMFRWRIVARIVSIVVFSIAFVGVVILFSWQMPSMGVWVDKDARWIIAGMLVLPLMIALASSCAQKFSCIDRRAETKAP